MNLRARAKAQSAIEYLSTYSLSILTIAVILGVIYFMGLFNFGATSAVAGACRPAVGIQCVGGIANTGGAVSFTFGISQAEAGTGPIDVLAIGCSNSTAAPTTGWSSSAVNVSPLYPGQSERAIAPCNINGGSGRLGSPVTGSVWLQYVPVSSQGTTPPLEEEIGSVSYTASSQIKYSTASTTVNTGGLPYGIAYNPSDGEMYVTENNGFGAGTVNVISGTTLVGPPIPIGTNPFGIAYDPINEGMYIATTAGTVNVITGNTVTASINNVGPDPYLIAYDPQNGYMYVTEPNAGTVNVISGTTILGPPIAVGAEPIGISYNPSNGYMYVANEGSNTVSVISGTTVISTINVGIGPYGVAYNPSNGYMYIADFGTGTSGGGISVISGTTDIDPVEAPSGFEGISYNPNNGCMYAVLSSATFGADNVICGTSTQVTSLSMGTNPSWAAYNPSNGHMYTTNWGSGTVSVT